MNSFIIVSYYTAVTLYEAMAKAFIESLKQYEVPYYVERIVSLGNWYANINYKPTFLKRMLERFPNSNIVWVDCDAKFFGYPKLFDKLDCNIAVYELDRAACYKNGKGVEVLSGTIFLKNNEEVFRLVERWEMECKKEPFAWDQKSLAKVIGDFHRLPGEYCKICDTMKWVAKPIIVHYQASRQVRKQRSGGLRMR